VINSGVPAPSSRRSRFPRFLFLLGFSAAIAAGAWYVQNGGWTLHEEEIAEEEEEGFGTRVDAGAPKRRGKKAAASPKKKLGSSRQARSSPLENDNAPAAPPPGPSGPSGPSYESAIAGNNLDLAPGTAAAPDLTDAELSGPMRGGTFLDACGVPASMKVTVKVAIRHGHAVGVSAYPAPANREMAWCIERHVRGLSWPSNSKMDSFVTTY
jgi:hypothetical protein